MGFFEKISCSVTPGSWLTPWRCVQNIMDVLKTCDQDGQVELEVLLNRIEHEPLSNAGKAYTIAVGTLVVQYIT